MSNFQKKITKLILTQLGITQIWKFMAATPIHFAWRSRGVRPEARPSRSARPKNYRNPQILRLHHKIFV